MRIHFSTSPSAQDVPFTYKTLLLGWLHKHLAENNTEHDTLSLYSVSNLSGSIKTPSNMLRFPRGAQFFLSFYDKSFGQRVLQSILTDSLLFCGMNITDVQLQETPVFPERMRFSVASPVLVKQFNGTSIQHLTYNHPDSDVVMTRVLQTKLQAAGLPENIKVSFDKTYHNPGTKLIDIHGIKNRANVCPVVVEGVPELVAFAWNVGVGHSTGSGFGALR